MKALVNKLKKYFVVILISLFSIVLFSCEIDEKNNNNNGEKPPLVDKYINGISILSESKTNQKIEFEIYETENYLNLNLNPYDYSEFKIIGKFTSPSNEIKEIYSFWFQDYNVSLDTSWKGNPSGISGQASTNPNEPQGLETAISEGDPHFRFRYITSESGNHELEINVYLDDKKVQTLDYNFEVEEGEVISKGVLKIDETNNRHFAYNNGETFIAVGQNTAWHTSSTRQTEDYRVWFEKMSENGANFARIWMGTWNYSLHFGEDFDNFDSRQPKAIRLDKLFDLADEYDMHFMLALINHGQFSALVNPQWSSNPWNKVNGGILDRPNQFFTNLEAKEIYKQQLIYIISRWAYSDKVIWELWNEVDWTDSFNDLIVRNWHFEMANFITQIDPYNHLVTTSYKGNTGSAYGLENIAFSNPHDYGYANVNVMEKLVPNIDNLFNRYGKPVLASEIGIGWQNGKENRDADPTGVSIKQNQWAGIMGGSLGGAMNWWWDSFVHPLDLYYRFKGAGEFAKKMDLVGDEYNLLHKLSGVQVNNNNSKILGYQVDDRIYGYLYDKTWTHKNTNIGSKDVLVNIPHENGSYVLKLYDTDTGELLITENLEITNNTFSFTFNFTEDKAFILKRR